MVRRSRSPDYPSMSLGEAVERVRALHGQIGQNPTSREIVASGMGYRSISGASAAAISTLKKYGLLEGRGEEIRVSGRAMAILHPHSDEERNEALLAAALEPGLFRELSEKFTTEPLNDELLKNYLLRNGFTLKAVSSVTSAYKETKEFVEGALESYDSPSEHGRGDGQMDHGSLRNVGEAGANRSPLLSGGSFESASERRIGGLDLGDAGSVRILATGMGTKKALSMARKIIEMVEEELKGQDSVEEASRDVIEDEVHT